jgi:hypothetical protein
MELLGATFTDLRSSLTACGRSVTAGHMLMAIVDVTDIISGATRKIRQKTKFSIV